MSCESIFLPTHPDQTGKTGDLADMEWIVIGQLFMNIMQTLRELSCHLNKVSKDTTSDHNLGEVFAAWFDTDAELSSEGKTDYAAKRTPTAWCWTDWIRLQSLAFRYSQWAGCRTCLKGEPIGKRTIHHLIQCRGARVPGPGNLRERTDAMDRDIESIAMIRDWMLRSGLHLGYNPSSDPPQMALRYKGIKRIQRGRNDIADVDKFPLRKKLYVFHGDESHFDMTLSATRSVTYSSSGEGWDSSMDPEPLLDTMALYRQQYGISPQHEESWSDQLANSTMLEESGDFHTVLLSILRRESDYGAYQAHLDHYFGPDSNSNWS
ncbi:hypothetical protein QFC20_005186 [Naganishia adeliensis]|uniref:Uncharacterized protein n=1 Tax=Naganishia adeliensis TaxID=92952 RepID=A0ACC2VR45_9TREE|nr:hypothetical protein QFC20_005186 [Naganishia adeliensis]